MKRKKPSFNETYHGYRTFSELLEDAAKQGLLELETDKRSRTYVVTRFGSEMHAPPTPMRQSGSSRSEREESEGGRKKSSRRRRLRKEEEHPDRAGPAGGGRTWGSCLERGAGCRQLLRWR